MKKTAFIFVIGAIALTSCSKAPKASLKSEVDTLSYAFGIANSDGLKTYLAMRYVDTTYMDAFIKGVVEGSQKGDAKQDAYLAGLDIGKKLSDHYAQINGMISAGDTTTLKQGKNNFLAGFVAGANNKATMTQEEAQTLIEAKMVQIQERTFAPNRAAGIAFLAENAKKEGVVVLSSGLQYKVINEGKGAKPAATDKVKVHYHGTLIDGTVFDSSIDRGQPATFGVNQVIKGWTEALQLMPVGSKWMLYIPSGLGYGEQDNGVIKPYSTLIFEVELLGIEK